ncbi:MAG: NAD(P)/FAD-dependent oxidoreductase, partial [Actinomycetes bacterium]
VVVVGAGLAGLAASTTLHRAGRTVVVLEAADDVGGRVRTDRVDGFLLDRGFQILLTAYPEAQRQLDLPALRVQAFEPGAVIRWGGRFHAVSDPFRRPGSLLRTATTPVIGLPDKLRIAQLRQRVLRGTGRDLATAPETTTEAHLQQLGFSQAAVDRLFRPLFGGIQLDPTLQTSSRMFDLIYRSLANGDAGVPADGMGAIPAQLAATLPPGAIRCNTPVTEVSGTGVTTAAGDSIEAAAVIVATDGPAAARLLGRPDVPGNAVSCCWFAAPTAPVDGAALILDGEGTGPAMNVAMMTGAAPSYSSDGRALIAAACPGAHSDDLATAVRAQLRTWWGAQVDEWQLLRTDHIAHAQPAQYVPFRLKRSVRVSDGLFVAGDHRDTASIQGALFSGRRCAAAVLGR